MIQLLLHAGKGAATLAFSENVLRMFGGKNLDSMKIISDDNLQQYKSLVIKEPEENRKISSIPKTNLEGVSLRYINLFF